METQPTLVIHSPDGTTRRMAFDSDLISIGRDPDKSLRLSHAMVSRSHAELWRDSAGSVHVRDIHSRNHTFVNGELIIDRLLHDGDEIGIGPFVILLRHAKDTSKVPVGDDGARVTRLQDHAAPHIDVSQINTLKDFTRKLLDTAGEGDRAQALCDLLVGPQFRGHWAAIVRLGPTEAQAPVLLQQARAPLWVQEPYLSRGVLRTVRKNGQAVLASNVGDGSNFAVNVDISISPNERALAAIACPLRNTPAEIDVLYIMLPPVLGAPEWLALVNLTAQEFQLVESFWIARKAAEEAAIFEREIARARQIQMRLVPTEANIAGLELAIGFTPCHRVGGDYVDIVPLADGRTLLAIADVCGKGLGAALVASSVHTMVHAAVLSGLGLAELMTNLNRYLCRALADDSFVTMIAIVIDPVSGEVEMANAGHPPALVIAHGYPPRQLDGASQLPLGVEENEPTVIRRFSLRPDELLALYTDGLSELPDSTGLLLGIEGLSCTLQQACGGPPITARRSADELHRLLANVKGPRPANDDVTFLLARRVCA